MNPLHIHFLLDRSGSMESIRTDVIGGFNTFIAEQKALPDPCKLTLIQFDNQDVYELHVAAENILDVKELQVGDFVPRGGTPLYDAIGRTITEAQIRQEARAELKAPTEDVIVVIFTDGEENSSSSYTKEKVFELITKKEAEGWTFVYMGANQDSYAEGAKIGVFAGSTANYTADAIGTSTAYASLSTNMTNLRNVRAAGGTVSEDFFTDVDTDNKA